MKHKIITNVLWIILFLLTSEAYTLAYNFLYMPIFDPSTNEINFGSRYHDLAMLIITTVLFSFAGAIMAWRMKGTIISIISAMFIGITWLSLEIATRIPWFQLMPSHPTAYDHLLAFIGSASPPIACACGAYIFSVIIYPKYKYET